MIEESTPSTGAPALAEMTIGWDASSRDALGRRQNRYRETHARQRL